MLVVRSKGAKKLVVIAVQRAGNGISRAYARQIENAGVKALTPFFEDHIQIKPQQKQMVCDRILP